MEEDLISKLKKVEFKGKIKSFGVLSRGWHESFSNDGAGLFCEVIFEYEYENFKFERKEYPCSLEIIEGMIKGDNINVSSNNCYLLDCKSIYQLRNCNAGLQGGGDNIYVKILGDYGPERIEK